MDTMETARWRFTNDYLVEVFGSDSKGALAIEEQSRKAGLSPIAVTADIGQLLTLLVRMNDVQNAIEVGTLGGYSAFHILSGLRPGGKLISIEKDANTAAIATQNLAPYADRVRVEVGAALDVLPRLAKELGPASVQFVFLDADKVEYTGYFELLKPLLAEGGLLVADNVLGTRQWWIDDLEHPSRQGVDRFNRAIAADPEMDVAAVVARQGLLFARKRRAAERKP